MDLDALTHLKFLLNNSNGIWKIRADGKMSPEPASHAVAYQTPWVHQHHGGPDQCGIWHNLFFERYKLTPTYCMNCWKVVVFIPTVKELFDLYEVQRELEHPCKCGIELRLTDERRYGGYFYNWGKEAGLECYKKVRKAVDEGIGKNIKVILKCSCSEYEILNGPPNDWVVSDKQKELEGHWNKWIATTNIKADQPIYLVANVMLKWLHHAAHIGDLTYKHFTGGESLVKTMKTYHHEAEGEKENGNSEMAE
jgi:hypothetical protein